ncbi:MAG: hypothetical protein U0529_10310 [Thermoanaerobaculia bacterium]
MLPKLDTFRPGNGSVLRNGPTGRPNASSVGVGPIGCARFGDDACVNQTANAALDGASSLLQWSTSVLDWALGEYQAASYASTLCDAIKSEREFFLGKAERSAYDTAEKIAANAGKFFRKPFSGALVEWNVYTDYVVEEIPVTTYDPMVVLGYTDENVATGFEEKATARTAGPLRLALWHALDPSAAVIQKVANQQCSRRFFLLDMATVLLYPNVPSAWTVVADQTVDLRGPCLIDQFVEFLTPKPNGIL